MRIIGCFILFSAMCFMHVPAAQAQEVLGTTMGIPLSSPPVLWPRGMSIEALSPQNLYPNGPQFGLSNTSGGFGTSGTGPVSGVGLAQRGVSPLVQQEFQNQNVFVNRLSILESAERNRNQALLSGLTSSNFRFEMSTVISGSRASVQPYISPFSDTVLQDRASTVDSILKTGP